MTAAIDMSNTEADRALLRSPGLGQFRKSPFRLLRLPTNATAKQAVWQCDKALARARVGMSLPDPDPVPWLPPGDEIEIQEAAQTMESPLARLVEQLLWFDVIDDADGGALHSALTSSDGTAIRSYLNLVREGAPMAHQLNQANLRLLVGFSSLRESGPTIVAAQSAAQAAALAWQDRGGLSLVEDPHKVIRATGALLGNQSVWAWLLGEGVAKWGELLGSEQFAVHVRMKIEALGDELLGADDTEAVIAALRTRLADLVVGETKIEMAQGRVGNVAHLSSIAGKSKVDAETWLVAFRPLKTQFQSELAELAPDAETGNGLVEDVAAYLERLSTLAARWRPLDEAQLLGLSALIDEAVGEAFGKLRGIPREQQLEARFKEVIDKVGAVAHSSSIKERVKAYHERLADVQKAMCHFCGKRELEASSCASVSSQMETGREYYGNTTRIHYQVGARPVARCLRCSTLHHYIRNVGTIAFITLATAIVLFGLIHPPGWFKSISTGVGIVLVVLGVAAAYGAGFIAREIASSRVTPKGERKFGDYHGSTAVEGLRADGFVSMKYDYRPNAWELINKNGVKASHGGGDGAEVLKTLFYVGLFVAAIALKVCARN
ncbi:MAG: hypothetical protein H0T46_04040 [Deltaproteobacteria bacterium]|nr:hypothetical protein [Deltaproteobacteria bacterium]